MIFGVHPLKFIAGSFALLILVSIGCWSRVDPFGEIANGFEVNHHRGKPRWLNLFFASMRLIKVILEAGGRRLNNL